MSERVQKSILNAKVNILFYLLSLFLAFFSRKIFLDCLGAEFIGLNGTLGNILGYLNLAELGIGSCISFFLFKPLQSDNREKISELLTVFAYLYRSIGRIILIAGMVVSLTFPWVFNNTNLGLGIVYFSFYSILGSSLIGYFINYRQIILAADQKKYVVTAYMQTANLMKVALQIFLAYTYKNLYLWVSVEFLFGLIGCILLNWRINKIYPWLKTDKNRGKELLKKYPDILKNTKQIFIHRIKDFLLGKSDELFIFIFVSLKMVAYYGNYTIIVSKFGLLFSSVLDSINAGIGNLVAEGNHHNMMKVFWETTTIRHFVAGFLCFSIFHFIEPFISLWLGPEYILDRSILILLVICIYINSSRGIVDMYNHAHGLYGDVWAAWTELCINLTVTLVAGYFWGIAGILLGKVTSMGLIILFWKPYYLFHCGLHLPYTHYWRGASRNYLVSLISFIAAHIILKRIPIDGTYNYISCVLFCIAGLAIYLLINLTLIFMFCKGAKDSLNRIRNKKKRYNHSKFYTT